MPLPPQSLQLRLMRLCWQMLAPPQSLQMLLWRLCSQMLAPPQSLQLLLWRLCWQMLVPPQSLQLLLMRLCWQMLVPPQSLHQLLWRLCGQMLAPPQSLQRLRSQGRTGAPCRALPAHTPSQQPLLASQLQRHPARVLVRGSHNSLKLMLDLRARTVLPAPQRAAPRPARGRSLL